MLKIINNQEDTNKTTMKLLKWLLEKNTELEAGW